MQVENRVAVEADLRRVADEKLDRVLVVEDHLRFEPVAALRLLAELDQPLRVEQRVGVAFKTARIPRQVDQKPVQNLPRVGARRLLPAHLARPDLREVRARSSGKVERLSRTVGVQEVAVVADRLARGAPAGARYALISSLSGDSVTAASAAAASAAPRAGAALRRAVARPRSPPSRRRRPLSTRRFSRYLQRAARDSLPKGIRDFGGSDARTGTHDPLNFIQLFRKRSASACYPF